MNAAKSKSVTLPEPGGWRVETNGMGTVELLADGSGGDEWLIASAGFGPLDWRMKNFNLLAAAPELLTLAKTFAATVEYYIRVDEKSGDAEGARMKAMTLHLANALISKAEGR